MGIIMEFERKFFNSVDHFMYIGTGSSGGKAEGLAFINDIIKKEFPHGKFPEVEVNIPRLAVMKTDIFQAFMERNELYETALSDLPDDRIAHAFQKAEFPVEFLGDLRALIEEVKTPLAVRSSSLLEDAKDEPFAGIYATKMIPNNQFDADSRFRKLIEAVKFVYASTFFREARDYIKATSHMVEEEKMAVIIQEVVGQRFKDRFYPAISGVGRSYNFYTSGHSKPEDGVVDLALGLGKTIVDGGKVWTYSPAYPKANPPYGSIKDLFAMTQNDFWAVNMGKPPAYDPIAETEYLIKGELEDAQEDNILRFLASTYDGRSDRLYAGTDYEGPKLLTFSPVLHLEEIPLTEIISSLLKICEKAVGFPVEIEFAMTINPLRFGFLQVRPMSVSNETVEITEDEMKKENTVVVSEYVLGNGTVNNILDIVYVKPEIFNAKDTPAIAREIGKINEKLVTGKRPYLLIGFGRWGSSDPWLGIPVNWSQICGAKAIIEATLPEMNVDLSQGSHFFHNITGFKVSYFSARHYSEYKINWDFLNKQEVVEKRNFTKHVKLSKPLEIKVDGKTGRGVILY